MLSAYRVMVHCVCCVVVLVCGLYGVCWCGVCCCMGLLCCSWFGVVFVLGCVLMFMLLCRVLCLGAYGVEVIVVFVLVCVCCVLLLW